MSESEKSIPMNVVSQTGPNTTCAPVTGSSMTSPATDGSTGGSPVSATTLSQPGSGGPAMTGGSLSQAPVQQHHHPHVYPSMYKDTTFTKIFVGGLPYHTSDNTLREYFEVFGEIEEAVVITDRQTAKSRGYGFVTMLERSSAERACKEPNPIIDGRKANVNLAYLGAKPRTNGIAALHARAAAASYAPFLQSPLGYPSPYLYPSPILISPNLFLPNAGGGGGGSGNLHSATGGGNGNSPNSSGMSPNSTTSPPPVGGGSGSATGTGNNLAQSYYDFSTAAALAAAASSFVQQHHQYAPHQYAGAFGDPTALYNFAPYAAAAGLLQQNGGFGNGGGNGGLLQHHNHHQQQQQQHHLHSQNTSGQNASANSNLYNGGVTGALGGHHMPAAAPILRGEK